MMENTVKTDIINPFCDNFTPEEKLFLQEEKSRSVKFIFLKFKCIIVFSVLIIAVLEFIFIIVRELHASFSSAAELAKIFNFFINQENQTIFANFSSKSGASDPTHPKLNLSLIN